MAVQQSAGTLPHASPSRTSDATDVSRTKMVGVSPLVGVDKTKLTLDKEEEEEDTDGIGDGDTLSGSTGGSTNKFEMGISK